MDGRGTVHWVSLYMKNQLIDSRITIGSCTICTWEVPSCFFEKFVAFRWLGLSNWEIQKIWSERNNRMADVEVRRDSQLFSRAPEWSNEANRSIPLVSIVSMSPLALSTLCVTWFANQINNLRSLSQRLWLVSFDSNPITNHRLAIRAKDSQVTHSNSF